MNAIAAFFSKSRNLDDWLSPILVKELRQGMRGRIFVLSFLLLQVFLVLLTVGNLAARDDRNTLAIQHGFFWALLSVTLLLLTPMRGLAAISVETKNRTLETITLTRLTAWRVVFGKWTALFAQSLLLVSAVLPYVVLRYFIGGADVVTDFITLFLLLVLSGLLSAAAIAVSSINNPVIRIIVIFGLLVTSTFFLNVFSMPAWSLNFWETLWWLILNAFFIPALLFEITASGIAPSSENHAIRRRLLALAFFLGAVLLRWATGNDFTIGLVVALAALVCICYFDLAEKPRLVPRMARHFAQRGTLGKVASYFLLPGWPSALLFSLIVIPAASGLTFPIWEFQPNREVSLLLFILAEFGSILLPVFLCHVLWQSNKQVLMTVFFFNIALLATAEICEAFHALSGTPVNMALIVAPGLPVLTVMHNYEGGGDFQEIAPWVLLGNTCVIALLVALLLINSRGYFSELKKAFSTAPSGSKAIGPTS
jgi:hypothetical protein